MSGDKENGDVMTLDIRPGGVRETPVMCRAAVYRSPVPCNHFV